MPSHKVPKWCCVSSLMKIVTFLAVPVWSIPTPPALRIQHNARSSGIRGCPLGRLVHPSAARTWTLAISRLLRSIGGHARGDHRIKDEDRPKQTPLSTQQLLSRADRAGSQIGALCRGMHQANGEIAVRHILGMLSLVKKYGAATVDDACAAALEVGVYQYRFVRRSEIGRASCRERV